MPRKRALRALEARPSLGPVVGSTKILEAQHGPAKCPGVDWPLNCHVDCQTHGERDGLAEIGKVNSVLKGKVGCYLIRRAFALPGRVTDGTGCDAAPLSPGLPRAGCTAPPATDAPPAIPAACSHWFQMPALPAAPARAAQVPRSEERRVGKECRSRWSPFYYKKKQ